jgi:hypothetical protein
MFITQLRWNEHGCLCCYWIQLLNTWCTHEDLFFIYCPWRDFQAHSNSGSDMLNDYVAFSDHLLCGLSVKLSEPFLILDFGCSLLSWYYIMICCIKSDIPAPLAAKVYYSQRNTRLRSAVAYLYHATSAEGLNMVNSELSQESITQLLASSQKGSLDAQTNDLINEKVCTYCYFWWLNFHLAVVKCLVLKILEK